MERYKIEKSLLPNHYIVEDTQYNIFCMFEQGKFNETQAFSEIPAGMSAIEIARIMREMGDWLRINHYNKLFQNGE